MPNSKWQIGWFTILSGALAFAGVEGGPSKAALPLTPISSSPEVPPEIKTSKFTKDGLFTKGIEGPAYGHDGNLYVVNFQKSGTIGRVDADGKVELFLELAKGSVGNSIRFSAQRHMFIADYKKHNILVVEPGSKKPEVYFHDSRFHQPNDLTVEMNGVIYASDPDWKKKSGQIWRIERDPAGRVKGEILDVGRKMGTPNGIDLSPDEKTLYVGESNRNEIWSYHLHGDGKVSNPKMLIRFNDDSIDGLRTDIDGRIYVTRILKGEVVVLTAEGKVEREIKLLGPEPTNLAFGGEDGQTVYVTQRSGGYVETFRVDRPGREWCVVNRQDKRCRSDGLSSRRR